MRQENKKFQNFRTRLNLRTLTVYFGVLVG